jgi:hypothetical protein
MKVQFSVTGRVEPYRVPIMDMDAIPREGETVTLPGLEADLQIVRTVVWYPMGDPDDLGYPDERFVYIVLGPRRPE